MPINKHRWTKSGGGGSAGGTVPASGVTGITEDQIVRGDNATGIQGGTATLSDVGRLYVPGEDGQYLLYQPHDNAGSLDLFLRADDGGGGTYSAQFEMLCNTNIGSYVDYTVNGGGGYFQAAVSGINSFISLSASGGGSFINLNGPLVQSTQDSVMVGFLNLVEANTAGSGAPNVILSTENTSVFTNQGATAENYHTLPAAFAGLEFTFIVQDADGIRIKAAAGDTIRPIAGTAASAAAGFIRCATLGAFIRLQAINTTEWISTGSAGVWTIDV